MKKALLLIFICCTAVASKAQLVHIIGGKQYFFLASQWQYFDPVTNAFWPIDTSVLIKYKSTTSLPSIATFEQQHSLVLRNGWDDGWKNYGIHSSVSFMDECDTLAVSTLIDAFSVSVPHKLLLVQPNDMYTFYGQPQYWALNQIGAYQAWDTLTGGSVGGRRNVIVAVIDNGVEWNHEELGGTTLYNYENIWHNPGEDAWSNPNDPTTGDSVDNDNNGVIDDWKGANFGAPQVAGRANQSQPHDSLKEHGTAMAGVIGGKTNNGDSLTSPDRGYAGIAGGWGYKGCRIMSINVADTVANGSNFLFPAIRKGFMYAADNGAKVINYSAGGAYDDTVHAGVVYALSKKVTIIAGAGNSGASSIYYPARENGVIAVGITNINDSVNLSSSHKGPELDLVAPGVGIPHLIPNNHYYLGTSSSGSSFSTAYVAGTVALMLDLDSCLSPTMIEDILRHTAYTGGGYSGFNYHWNDTMPGQSLEAGYGRLNTEAAVHTAKSMQKSVLDLYIKDQPSDFGHEGLNANYGSIFWESPDIWIRNQADGLSHRWHQNPVYDSANPVYIYVRVHNKSCISSSGDDRLFLNWAKASSSLTWPQPWNGFSNLTGQPPLGDSLLPITIPILQPGQDTILSISWQPPNPGRYKPLGLTNSSGHFCLLARIISNSIADSMAVMLGSNLVANVQQNNNVAMKNVTIIGPAYDNHDRYLGVHYLGGTNRQNPIDFGVAFKMAPGYANLFDAAQVIAELDSLAWKRWNDGGRHGDGVEVFSEDERQILILHDSAWIANISFDQDERALMGVYFHFSGDSAADLVDNYCLRVIQSDDHDNTVGGETYLINKTSRSPFTADAGPDKVINKNEAVCLTAASIGEAAIYKWYDTDGNLVDSGQSITVNPTTSEQYSLMVIATEDGYEGWDEVDITVRSGHITSAYPVPVSNTLNVNYSLENVTSAYLVITQPYGSGVNSYIISPTGSSKSIDMSNFSSGIYNVVLVCDGTIQDATTIQKQ